MDCDNVDKVLCLIGVSRWKNMNNKMLSLFFILRCQIPGLQNDSYAVQGKQHTDLIHKFIPLDSDGEYDKCYLYNIDRSKTVFDNESRPINASKIKCSAWVYDQTLFHETFVMKVIQQFCLKLMFIICRKLSRPT